MIGLLNEGSTEYSEHASYGLRRLTRVVSSPVPCIRSGSGESRGSDSRCHEAIDHESDRLYKPSHLLAQRGEAARVYVAALSSSEREYGFPCSPMHLRAVAGLRAQLDGAHASSLPHLVDP